MNPFIQMLMQALQTQAGSSHLSPGTYRLPTSFAQQLYRSLGNSPQMSTGQVQSNPIRLPGNQIGQFRIEAPQTQMRMQQLTSLPPQNVYAAVTQSPEQLALTNQQANQFMRQPFQLQQQTNAAGQQYQPGMIGMYGFNTRGATTY